MSVQTTSGQKTVAEQVAEFALTLRYEDIPKEVVLAAKMQMLDALGIALLSNTTEIGKTVYRATIRASARLEAGGARVIGYGTRLPASDTTLINGVFINSLGFDGTHLGSGIHPCAPALAAVLAAGEEEHADGHTILAAYIAAIEIDCRLAGPRGNPFHPRGFHPTALLGTFAAAAAAARLRRLDLPAAVNALGLCGSKAAGLIDVLGSWQLMLHVGWAAHAGLMAASIAAEGFTGAPRIFESPNGFYQTHLGFIPTNEELRLDTLGKHYLTAEVSLKPYPNCQAVQAFTDAAFALKEEGIGWQEVEHVEYLVTPVCYPLVIDPPTLQEYPLRRDVAGFSIPYAVAGAMIKGRADYAFYHEDPLDDPEIMSFVKRFDHAPDPDSDFPRHFPGELRVTLRDGRRIAKRIVASKGTPEWPMSRSEVETKFLDHASRVMSRDKANRLAETVSRIDDVKDVEELLDAACDVTAEAYRQKR
ncbi:MAG: MmgE/PrpD family protein [Syntrophorhabdus sp. PtaU1.Bin058]|nr:MAG: MmgE/PrpD family protein [Syntrophorhabdus sp. PtaU1.Bin058]